MRMRRAQHHRIGLSFDTVVVAIGAAPGDEPQILVTLQWLTDTESVVPDNDMGFRVPKQEERAAIISYLKGLSNP